MPTTQDNDPPVLKDLIHPGDVVRIADPNSVWSDACLLIVEELRDWGVIGFVPLPNGNAPLRLAWHNISSCWRYMASNQNRVSGVGD